MNWIACTKEMPHKYEDVLVWVIYADGSTDFTSSFFIDDRWAMGSARKFVITHWMRIVEPCIE